jgi:hypothetical protein
MAKETVVDPQEPTAGLVDPALAAPQVVTKPPSKKEIIRNEFLKLAKWDEKSPINQEQFDRVVKMSNEEKERIRALSDSKHTRSIDWYLSKIRSRKMTVGLRDVEAAPPVPTSPAASSEPSEPEQEEEEKGKN